jgi:hypothetical protein
MSVLATKADIAERERNVRYVPKADISAIWIVEDLTAIDECPEECRAEGLAH